MNASMIGTAMALLLLIPARALATPDAARLEHLLTQDCGACHGLYLTGGLGPPLTPAALAGHSRDSLTATIPYGRPARAMPGWSNASCKEAPHHDASHSSIAVPAARRLCPTAAARDWRPGPGDRTRQRQCANHRNQRDDRAGADRRLGRPVPRLGGIFPRPALCLHFRPRRRPDQGRPAAPTP